jgi:fructokinase
MNNLDAARPLIFGEVLFDHFPDGGVVLGGAPFNVAAHLQALGISPLLVSRVGDDPLGRRIRDTMLTWGMDTSGLQLDSAHPTGTVEVTIEQGEPRFSILAERAYDFIDPSQLPPVPGCSLLYHGSLALRGATSKSALDRLDASLGTPLFMDVNLRAPWWDVDSVRARISAARWTKLNESELRSLVQGGTGLEAKARALQKEFDLELLIVTRGGEGALVCEGDGSLREISVQASGKVVDTVGAGDAFSAVVILGLLRGWGLETTFQRAQRFAGAMVGIQGAIPRDRGFYARFSDDWSTT